MYEVVCVDVTGMVTGVELIVVTMDVTGQVVVMMVIIEVV